MNTKNLEGKEDLPVIEVFGNRARRQVISYALRDMTTSDWQRTGEITEHVDVGRESVRKALKPLVAYGVLDVRDPDVNMPHYRLADTPVVDAIDAWDGYPLSELFAFKGRQSLVRFFLTKANPDESYSMNAISKQSGIKNSTVADHVDVLVDAGLLNEVEGRVSTEYQLDTASDIYQYLADLNEVLYQTYQERRD